MMRLLSPSHSRSLLKQSPQMPSMRHEQHRKEKSAKGHAHLPRDHSELSFECLIFAHDVPNANWEKRSPGSGRVFYETKKKRAKEARGGGGAYQCQKRQLKRNSIPWEIHARRSCSERVRCTLSQARDSFTHFPPDNQKKYDMHGEGSTNRDVAYLSVESFPINHYCGGVAKTERGCSQTRSCHSCIRSTLYSH